MTVCRRFSRHSAGDTMSMPTWPTIPPGISRRDFLETTAATVVVATTVASVADAQTPAQAPALVEPDPAVPGHDPRDGKRRRRQVAVEDRWTLAELLRDHLGLTGTKIGCTAASAARARADGRQAQ
jgi:hypothetical protein